MKILFQILLLSVGLNIASSQTILDLYPKTKAKVDSIENLSQLDTVLIENEEYLENMTDGGGHLEALFSLNKIVKIKSWVGLSYGIEIIEYYINNNNLIYVQETRDGFVYDKKTQTLDHSKVERNVTGHYIFKSDSLLKEETTGHNRFENDELDAQTILPKEAEGYIKFISGVIEKRKLTPTKPK